jgi:hypothetical protein
VSDASVESAAPRRSRLLRVAEHVRTQNWTAIGIDFCIVVLGVFVGIQVSNWNAERTERQRGAEFTERLRADLDGERWVYEFMIAYYSDVRDAADVAVGALEGTATVSNHDLLVAAYRATQYREGARRRDTYDELVSTGSLGLIADQRLLANAAAIYRLRTIENVVRESMEQSFRSQFRQSIPNAVQRELARRCGDRIVRPGQYEGIDSVIDYPCTLELPPSSIDAAAQALRSDPAVLRALRLRIADLDTRLGDFTVNNRDLFEGLTPAKGATP